MEERTSQRERELVLAPNEFVYVQDTTKGHVVSYVGPNKTSLSNTDKLVVFDEHKKAFREVSNMKEAIQLFCTAPENWYMSLKNPAVNSEPPKSGSANMSAELDVGKKVNIPGPVSQPLWPGQMCRVIEGHTMRSNQYLKVRIYDVEQAKTGWNAALGLPTETEVPEFVAGQIEIIKDVSFYIPPTGVEVLTEKRKDTKEERFVLNAITLQRLEYCILRGEDGKKDFVRGEAVVFPRPTQRFVEDERGQCKFKAIELSEAKGIHVKVIAPYKDNEGVEHKEGEELFIFGQDRIYFPRAEHAIIRYGDSDLIFAIAVPVGEGRYVLNRLTGEIKLERGPTMLMPDPRSEVIVRRVLTDKQCTSLYPGNSEALKHNRGLRSVQDDLENFAASDEVAVAALSNKILPDRMTKSRGRSSRLSVKEAFAGDDFVRSNQYTPPRTITLDTKFEGAVKTELQPGFALQVVSQSGERSVIQGPKMVLLEYNEFPEILGLSTGKPKNNNGHLKHTPFLQVRGNKVTDLVELTTKDMVQVLLKVKYRVNFEGDSNLWFNVSNYVQLLCDHGNSRLKAAARSHTIQSFRNEVTNIVREAIVGAKDEETGERAGMQFEENDMRVFDVEVLDFNINDGDVNDLMHDAQFQAIKKAVELESAAAALELDRQTQEIRRTTIKENAETEKVQVLTRELLNELQHNLAVTQQNHEATLMEQRKEAETKAATLSSGLKDIKLADDLKAHEQNLLTKTEMQELVLSELAARVEAKTAVAQAFTPHMIEALTNASNRDLMTKISQNFGELAAIKGQGIMDTAKEFMDMMPQNLMPVLAQVQAKED